MRTTLTSMEVKGFWDDVKVRAAQLQDFLVPGEKLTFDARGGPLEVVFGENRFLVSGRTHGQLSADLGIPKRYYDRLLGAEKLSLLAANLTSWATDDSGYAGKTRLVRTVGSRCRAILSDQYRPIDSWDVAATCLEQLGNERAEVLRSYVDDDRLNLTAIRSDVGREFTDGGGRTRTVHPGVRIINDETGGGACVVEPFAFDTVCTNGVVFGRHALGDALRFVHLGGRETLRRIILSEETRRLANQTIYASIRDTVHATFSPEKFGQLVDLCCAATARRIDAPADAVFEVVRERYGMTEQQRDRALEFFLAANDRTQYGLAMAVNQWDVIGVYQRGEVDALESAAGDVIGWSGEDLAGVEDKARRLEVARLRA